MPATDQLGPQTGYHAIRHMASNEAQVIVVTSVAEHHILPSPQKLMTDATHPKKRRCCSTAASFTGHLMDGLRDAVAVGPMLYLQAISYAKSLYHIFGDFFCMQSRHEGLDSSYGHSYQEKGIGGRGGSNLRSLAIATYLFTHALLLICVGDSIMSHEHFQTTNLLNQISASISLPEGTVSTCRSGSNLDLMVISSGGPSHVVFPGNAVDPDSSWSLYDYKARLHLRQ